MAFKIFFNSWIKLLHSVPSFLRADSALKLHNLFWGAERFGFTFWPLSGNMDTVVYTTVSHTCSTVDTQIIYDSDVSSFPI